MDIQKIATFVDLAATLSFTATAENLFLTQATVTKHIQSLEKEWAVTLFVRNQHKVELTKVGAAIVTPARNVVADYRGIKNVIRNVQDEEALDLRITTIPTVTNYKAFGAITNFHLKNPDVHLKIQELESQQLRPSLERADSDVIFIRTFGDEDQDLETIVTETDEFVAVMPVNHPLVQTRQLDLGQLAGENLLVLGAATNMYDPFLALVRLAGFHPQITYSGERIDLILDLVNSGMGIGVLMGKSMNLANYPNLIRVPLKEQIHSQLVFARKAGTHAPANERIWSFLKTTFANPTV